MNGHVFSGIAAVAFGVILPATAAFSQSQAPKSPGWSLQLQSPSANLSEQGGGGGGRRGPDRRLATCEDDTAKYCTGKTGAGVQSCLMQNKDKISGQCSATLSELQAASAAANGGVPGCSHSPLCSTTLGGTKATLPRVEWKQTMGYTFAYPFVLPLCEGTGGGGVSGVAVDSKGNLWAYQRNAAGQPQLFEFDKNHKLVRTVGEDVIGRQYKAHGVAVDAQDNVWICDANGSTVEKLSPEGDLLMTIGVRGHRGDWNEAKEQRLLWQPMDVAFGPNGDVYIGEGHADESPNDVGSDDPTNVIGVSRVIHLDKSGKFINQWYGNSWGPGKFESVHGLGVDPKTGNVWLGDRDQYRIVVYSGEGKFIKTLSMRNLVCAIYFDSHDHIWVATGNDGQLIRIDQEGNVLGAIGNGRGTGPGQFMETNFMGMDPQGNLYTGDTTVARITEMAAPKK
jgi:DNA-binding beta-propeller fold protein YncE